MLSDVIKSDAYTPNINDWCSGQPFIRCYVNEFNPLSSVVLFLHETPLSITPSFSKQDEIREHISNGTIPLGLCLEILNVVPEDDKYYNVSFSRDNKTGQGKIIIDNHPAIVFN